MGNENDKDQTIKKDNETVAFAQKKTNGYTSITGRPNIDKISKRNEEAEKRYRKSSYIKIGIIVLCIVVVVVLIYFFS